MEVEEEKKKKGTISEEDASLLLQRYSATAILALLQEVSQFPGEKIDWNTLVKKTSTGITSARECQMLWRHLAYRDTLWVKYEDGVEPLDDDSDLEFEVEAAPAISAESSLEAAVCVKVLISSVSQRGTCPMSRSTVEAPLTINIPNEQKSLVTSDKRQLARCTSGVNITVPVSVQKQFTPVGPSADLDGELSTGSGLPCKKKKKVWSDDEEKELTDAVQKYGEGNWAAILKGNFKHNLQNRTVSQMSQRWSLIRKRQANLRPEKLKNSTREEMVAAQKALSLAIDMPMTRNFSTLYSGTTPSSTPASSSRISAHAPIQSQQALYSAASISAQVSNQSQQALYSAAAAPKKGATNLISEAQPIYVQAPNRSQQALYSEASKKGATNPSSEAHPFSGQAPNQSQQAFYSAASKRRATNPTSEAQPISAQAPNQSQQALYSAASTKGATTPISEPQPISAQAPNQSQQALILAASKKRATNPISETQSISSQAPNQAQQPLNSATSKKRVTNSISEAQLSEAPNQSQQVLYSAASRKRAKNPISEEQPIPAQAPNQSQQTLHLAASKKGATNPSNKHRTAPKRQIAPSMPLDTPVMPSTVSMVPPGPPVPPSATPVAPPAPPVVPSTPPVVSPASPVMPPAPAVVPTTTAVVSSAPPVMLSCSNSSIQAAALAAGGRIATASTAASLIKAANSKSAVRIMPMGSITTAPGTGKSLFGTKMPSLQKLGTKGRRTQFIIKPPSSSSSTGPLSLASLQARGSSGKPASFSASSSVPTSNKPTLLETKSGALVSATKEMSWPRTGSISFPMDVDNAADDMEQEADYSVDEHIGDN